jgi:hypothetical protein
MDSKITLFAVLILVAIFAVFTPIGTAVAQDTVITGC